jgi:hypothetical protein
LRDGSEARLYSYKIDRLTGDVLPEFVDRSNHIIEITGSQTLNGVADPDRALRLVGM